MATLPLFAAGASRSLVAVAAIVALLLPLPARCASCATSDDGCPRCLASKADGEKEANVPRSCCQTHAPKNVQTSDSIVGAAVHAHQCGCTYRPVQRTVPPVEKLSVSPELIAGLVQAVILPAILLREAATTGYHFSAALPPPVPHRILHCSWII